MVLEASPRQEANGVLGRSSRSAWCLWARVAKAFAERSSSKCEPASNVPRIVERPGAPQLLDVEEVLFASGGELVSDQIVLRDDDGGDFAVDFSFDAMFPGFIEGDSVDALKDVNACRGLADLEDRAVLEVSWAEAVQRRAVLRERSKHSLAVFPIGPEKISRSFVARGSACTPSA